VAENQRQRPLAHENAEPDLQILNEKLLEAQSVEEAEQLIAQGAQISAKSWTNDTPLHKSCNDGNLALVEFYLSKGTIICPLYTSKY
jgi:ankyrin repeat protein